MSTYTLGYSGEEIQGILEKVDATYTKTEVNAAFVKSIQKNIANGVVGIDGNGYLGTQKLSTYTEKIVDMVNLSGAVTLNLVNGRIFKGIITGAITSILFTNIPQSMQTSVTLYLTMGATSLSVQYSNNIKWAYNAIPNLQTNRTHELVFKCIDGVNWLASKVGEYA